MADLNLIMTTLRQSYILGSHWLAFTYLLGMRSHVSSYSEEVYRGDTQSMLYSLLIEWIRFKNPTWKNLIEALNMIDEHRAADEISAYLIENKQ